MSTAAGTTEETATSHPWRRRFGTALLLLILTVGGYLAGIASTSLWPTPIQTEYYEANVSLEAWPSSTVTAPTVFGDVEIGFDGPVPAPGIRVDTQVKRDVTDLFASDKVSVDAFKPSDAEIRQAAGDALRGVALRFGVGLVVADVLVLLLLAIGRRRRLPTLRQTTLTAVATVIALIAPTLAGWQTYRVDRVSAFTTTSLLGTVRSNAGLLTDVQTRAKQVSRYVTNVLALSQSLQENLAPTELNQPAAIRLMMVSDIHGANQYPIIQRVIADEKIDAVIDTGDLLNFGSIQEAEASGIFTSIRQLGVPYIFARGNHDATSATDEALLRRLAQLPNVVLVEPSSGQYQQISVGGVTIGGLNDPRYYGDSDPKEDDLQKDSQKDFLRAYDGRTLPDIVISHEPAAVEGIDNKGLLVNGHVHEPDRDGNRVSVGTFTGGGLFGKRIADEAGGDKGGERETATYFFDIAVYGQTCSLVNLTRYSFRSIVEGRPAYDGLSVINGRSITSAAPEGRTCGTAQGMDRTTIGQ